MKNPILTPGIEPGRKITLRVEIEPPAPGQWRVRRIISRAACRATTKYPSVRLDRSVHCESRLEVELAELLDACAQVTHFGEQPARLRFSMDGAVHSHVPDFLAQSATDRTFFEVKFVKDVTADVLARTQCLIPLLAERGYRYRLVTERQLRQGSYLDNARYLLRRGRAPVPRTVALSLLTRVRAAGTLRWDAIERDNLVAEIARLILDGALAVPMQSPLGPQTQVTAATNEEGEPWAWALFN